MSTETFQLKISGMNVDVVRKSIKNLHLGVYPPAGRVRVAAPSSMSDDAVRLAVINRLGWVKRQRAQFKEQQRQSERNYVTGETHYYFERGYRLRVVEADQTPEVRIVTNSKMEMSVRPEATWEQKERLMHEWLRQQLKSRIDPLIEKWEPIVGVEISDWGVKRMKTKWGSCNIEARRIWLNLELAKKPPECLEYIVVHELTHLHERNHNEKFIALMDKAMPNWRTLRNLLNSAPLANENWEY